MDRRSWPWKKKTSEKTINATDSATASAGSGGTRGDQDNSKSANYVQISKETYIHLTELKDQVKVLNDDVKVLNEKLSTAEADLLTKDNLVKQHAKVAEEAVSGWEKAEAEALALKNQLESVTLLKLTAEERASHLDGALKECMKQIRTVKEDSEQKLHDVVFAKTKQWEKVKFELDSRIVEFEHELLRASAENAALSRSLQERSNMLMKVSDEKSTADEEIEVLKANIQSCEREISSLKYEVQVVSKELEIRNEEKNMSVRSAEVANKQHLEDIKKIAKLEAECQRLRGLVRKRLPGPAALAQMKQEVENWGRDYGETRLRRSPAKSASPRLSHSTDFALENIQQCHKETEFLTARLLAMEEETKMLREALSKRNNELLASRNICAKTSSKLRSIEAHMFALDQQRISKSSLETPLEGSLNQSGSHPPSLTSMSEDGIDEEGSCSDSWATALMSELSHFRKEKDVYKPKKAKNSNSLDLMDDFLEMEKLACLSAASNGTVTSADGTGEKMRNENLVGKASVEVHKDRDFHKEQLTGVNETQDIASSNEEQPPGDAMSKKDEVLLSKLQSRVVLAIEAQTKDFDIGKLLEDIKGIVHDTQEELPRQSISCIIEESNTLLDKHCPEDMGETVENGISLACDDNSCVDAKTSIDPNLKTAISHIHDFVASVCKEALGIKGMSSDSHLTAQKVGEFSDCVCKVLRNEICVDNFIVVLSSILCEIKESCFWMAGDRDNEGESNSSDYIDKVTLLENKVEPGKERCSIHCDNTPNSDSYPDNQNGDASPVFELKDTTKCSTEEFLQLKLEKDGLQDELARCTESLEQAKTQLLEMEQQLVEHKSQLAASHKSNSFAETQLKCMTESYKSLETRAQELQNEISLLSAKAETLRNELQKEKRCHQEALVKCTNLQEQLERYENGSTCEASGADDDIKTKQEREIAAAAEKLAECQETILLLGRQLKALRPSREHVDSSPNRLQMNEDFLEDVHGREGSNGKGRQSSQLSDHVDLENIASFLQRTACESPLDGFNPLFSPPHAETGPFPRSPISSKRSKHRSSRSSSSCSSSNPAPEKHGRGFSRFFSKGRSDH